jgi:hypothetical protein
MIRAKSKVEALNYFDSVTKQIFINNCVVVSPKEVVTYYM